MTETITQHFYERLLEIEGEETFDVDRWIIQMSFSFAMAYLYEMTHIGDRIEESPDSVWTHYHQDGYPDYRFTINAALPVGSFWIRLAA